MNQVKTIVTPIAGAGTRLRPMTFITPKEMLRLVDRPILYYLLKEAYDAGIRHAVFVVHSDKKAVMDFLKSKEAKQNMLNEFPGLKLFFVETKLRLGDGQAIFEARHILKNEKAFAVTMGDLISMPGTSLIGELRKVYSKNNIPVISVEKIDKKKSKQYGIIDPKKTIGRLHIIRSIIEKPEPKEAPSDYAMTGKYILTPAIFSYLGKLMKNRKSGEEVKLANALRDYAKDYELHAYACKNKHFDTGNKADLVKTEIIFALRHPEIGSQVRSALKSIIKN